MPLFGPHGEPFGADTIPGVDASADQRGGTTGPAAHMPKSALTYTRFSNVAFAGSARPEHNYRIGDRVRIKTSRTYGHFGEIEEILVEGPRSDGYKGLGFVRLKRFPEQLHHYEFPVKYTGGEVDQKTVDSIRKNIHPVEGLNNENCGHVTDADWKAEMSKQSQGFPAALRVFHTFNHTTDVMQAPSERTKEVQSRKMVKATVEVADTYTGLDFAVRVLDGNNKPITKTKNGPVRVTMRVVPTEGEEMSRQHEKDMKRIFNTHTDDGEEILSADDVKYPRVGQYQGFSEDNVTPMSTFFHFPGGNNMAAVRAWWCKLCSMPGSYTVRFECEGAESMPVYSEPKTVIVKAGPPEAAELFSDENHSNKNWESGKMQGKLEDPLASKMRFIFNDLAGSILNISASPPKVNLMVMDPIDKGNDVFKATCKASVDVNDPQVLWVDEITISGCSCGKAEWQGDGNAEDFCECVREDCLTSKKQRKIKFLVAFSFPKERVEITSRKHYTVIMFPGKPESCKIEGDFVEDDIVTVSNGSTLAPFTIQLVDANGIDTFPPKRDLVQVKLQSAPNVFDKSSVLTVSVDAKGGAKFDRVMIKTDRKSFDKEIQIDVVFTGEMGRAEDMFKVKVHPSQDPKTQQVWYRGSSSPERIF